MTRYKVRKADGYWTVSFNRPGRDEEGEWHRLATTEKWDVAIYVATSDPANAPVLDLTT